MKLVRRFQTLVMLVLLAATVPAQTRVTDLKPTVILIALDGFRPDYLERYKPPVLTRLAGDGVRAKWMTPSYPTKTFPNLYTIVTGLYPENHGIVENSVYDFGDTLKMDDRKQVQNPRWWGGEPIWATAERQGQIAASYFWVGSEAPIGGRQPTHWRIYNGDVPPEMRVAKALEWLEAPADKRPTMITLYFSHTDDVGHEFGPDAEETKYAVLNADRWVGQLMDGLSARGIANRVDVIIVSDHGMAKRDQKNVVVMDDYFDTKDKSVADPVLTSGEIWQIFPKPGKEEGLIARLREAKNATCWLKSEIPERLHYRSGSRVAPIVCSPDEGWSLTTRDRFETAKKSANFHETRGAHGYDNRYESMRATFLAHGPSFKKGFVAEPFENIHVYEIMCKILGLKPGKNDGSLEVVRGMMRVK